MKRLPIALLAALAACSSDSRHEGVAGGDVAAGPDRPLAQAVAADTGLVRAQAAIDSGNPWRATQLLAPRLRAAAGREPATLILAARAAAGWGGWSEVDKLLGKEMWLDKQFEGEGRELLARSALERGADTTALEQATLALRAAKSAKARADREVFLARALERMSIYDSATILYTRASAALPAIKGWLALRAAGVESDSAKREKLYASVRPAPARARIKWTEAQTRERFQDAAGAAARFAALGATVQSLRLRTFVAHDDATRAELLAYVKSHSGTADARAAVDILDRAYGPASAADELMIARSTAASGPLPRAISAFERALAEPARLTPADRMSYAQVLSRAGRSRDALAQLALVEGPLAGQAAYQRARVFLTSGTGDQTRAALRDVIARFPSDTGAITSALFLLADLSIDDGKDAEARSLYQQLYRGYPRSSRADDARFHSAMIAYAGGNPRAAAADFDSIIAVAPNSGEANAARYWSGRASAALRNTTAAQARWRELLTDGSMSYYSTLAAKRLDAKPWVPPARADSFVVFADIDSAVARFRLLDRLGMDAEARFELDALDEAAGSSPERLASTANALLKINQSSRAIRLAQKLVDAGQRDARAYRLLYPALDRDELARTAGANDLDPALVAGLIRQESSFNPRAISAANARGLMQVLPSVGEEVARGLKFPVWYPALLLDADANLQLGTSHLAAYMKQYGPLPRVLAAYNAGGSRVNRWSNRAGVSDPELFAERIPFVETRDYVRIVQRNAEMYRALYSW
jgi:soluble lytic murein transglycosylase